MREMDRMKHNDGSVGNELVERDRQVLKKEQRCKNEESK